MSHSPGAKKRPEPSITRALAGTLTVPCGPTATIRSPSITAVKCDRTVPEATSTTVTLSTTTAAEHTSPHNAPIRAKLICTLVLYIRCAILQRVIACSAVILQDSLFMPKLKTHKGAAKRFKKTGTGKVKRRHAFARHILTSKSRTRKRRLGQSVIADDANAAEIKRMIPY
jgi:large subunit ribosomal protein L35